MLFRLAPMSGLIAVLTAVFLATPLVMAAAVLLGAPAALAFVAAAIALTDVATYLAMRPLGFVLEADALEIVWPVRRRRIPWSDVTGASLIAPEELRAEFGVLLRVGVGGLWGAFGLAWSSRGRHLGLYVSRHGDGFVLVRCGRARSLLVTPERPAEFAAAVSARAQPGSDRPSFA
jgi:hypothetical protein